MGNISPLAFFCALFGTINTRISHFIRTFRKEAVFKMKKSTLMKRSASILLILAMMLAFMPVIQGNHEVYAGGDTDISGIIYGLESDGTVLAGSTITVSMADLSEKYGTDMESLYKSNEVKAGWSISVSEFGDSSPVYKAGDYSDGVFSYKVQNGDVGKWIRFETSAEDSTYNNQTEAHEIKAAAAMPGTYYLVKPGKDDYPDGSFTLTGHSEGTAFRELIVYDDYYGLSSAKQVDKITAGVNLKNDFSIKIDVSKYPVGIYNIVGVRTDDLEIPMTFYSSGTNSFYETYFDSPITEKPVIACDSQTFATGYDYVCFRPNFTVPKDSHTNEALFGYIWLQLYDTKTGEWGDYYGPFDSYENLYTEYFKGNKSSDGTKIAANRTYKARVQYRKQVNYNGGSTIVTGPYSDEVTFNTGKSTKPSVKSITIKAKKPKKKTLITHAHWDIYGKWHPYKKSYIWTTTYTVTVKLKKKPGAEGLMIGDKKVKGNKTTYKATFTDSGKLKGKKITIGICSYNDPDVGGYGKVYKKKVKVK